jgi:drug/metabolite transporter (DMT)-like permease
MDESGSCNDLDPYQSPVALMEPDTPLVDPSSSNQKELRPPMGLDAASICGLIAAVFYTLANIALRSCVEVDPFLVSAGKAAPTVILLGPFLAWMFARGDRIATSTKMVPRFILASLLGQIVGNAAFQIALGVIGLAASVPITLGVLIIGSAILGRVFLSEPVRANTVISMVTLIVAVVFLSLPGSEPASSATSSLPVWAGALCAAASGAAYSVFGVAMRQALTGGMSATLTMFISGVVGSIALWAIVFSWIGVVPLSSITIAQWGMMSAAGVCNLSAFAALSASLKSLPVVAVNLINATQVAMAAVAGVLLFAEPVTFWLVAGILLTFIGLMVLAGGRKPPAN